VSPHFERLRDPQKRDYACGYFARSFPRRCLTSHRTIARLLTGFAKMTDGVDNLVISFGPYCVVKARRLLERNGDPVRVGSRAFDILVHLLDHPGQVVSHRALIEAAWPGLTVDDGNLRFQMTALRKALGNADPGCIINVPGRGYCFTAEIAGQEPTGCRGFPPGFHLANCLPSRDRPRSMAASRRSSRYFRENARSALR
jgi:DNA-binding winged helix-turn-helix (wHTH) protein